MAASSPIAQNAPCSRYLKWESVFFSTSINVSDLTNIAQIQSPNAMIIMFFVNANAHITPSNEKLASNISRYINVPNHPASRFALLLDLSCSCKSELSDDIIRNVITHIIPDFKNVAVSSIGNPGSLVIPRNVRSAKITSIDSNFHRFAKIFSIDPTQWILFVSSKKNHKNTIKRNDQPNAASAIWLDSMIVWYLSGSCSAICNACRIDTSHMILTIATGKIILIPNTAITIHRVKNLLLHTLFIFSISFALIIALSNDNDTSNIESITVMKSACQPPT